jgi:outer membrane biosynthesis protein TonB
MREWINKHVDKEDQFGLGITAAIHIVILLIAILYTVDFNLQNRASFMEVTLGEFRSGTIAEQADVQREQVATRPGPVETPPEDPDPEVEQPAETPQNTVEETTKPVNLPEQTEEVVDDETVETPETDIINPEVQEETEVDIEEVVPPQTQEAEEVTDGVEERKSRRPKRRPGYG